MIVLIDNYDSFTYNLVQYLEELGAPVKVFRNDAITVAECERLRPSHIVISPGPCTPNESGISRAVIHHFKDKIPLLGVCLGHQTLADCFGARIIRAPRIMHGKLSRIRHTQQGVFQHLPKEFKVTRYHSLVIDPESCPSCLEVTAWSLGENPVIMGIAHRNYPLYGVQFHPEALLTEHGHDLLNNFLQMPA